MPPLTRPMEEMCERYFGRTALLVDADVLFEPGDFAGGYAEFRIRSG